MVCTSRAQGACSRSASAKHLCAVHSQVRESDVVDLLRVTFTNNSALVGGAVGVYLATRLSIRDCTFSNNIATVLGGALYMDSVRNTANLVGPAA